MQEGHSINDATTPGSQVQSILLLLLDVSLVVGLLLLLFNVMDGEFWVMDVRIIG